MKWSLTVVTGMNLDEKKKMEWDYSFSHHAVERLHMMSLPVYHNLKGKLYFVMWENNFGLCATYYTFGNYLIIKSFVQWTMSKLKWL